MEILRLVDALLVLRGHAAERTGLAAQVGIDRGHARVMAQLDDGVVEILVLLHKVHILIFALCAIGLLQAKERARVLREHLGDELGGGGEIKEQAKLENFVDILR